MSKFKFRIFASIVSLIILCAVYFLSFNLTSGIVSKTSFENMRKMSISLSEDKNYYYASFIYEGTAEKVEISFKPDDINLEAKRTFFNFIKVKPEIRSEVVLPMNVTRKGDYIVYNPNGNDPLVVRIEKNIKPSSLYGMNRILYMITPSPTTTELKLEFTIKAYNNDDVVYYDHYVSENIKNGTKSSPITLEDYTYVPTLSVKAERNFFGMKSKKDKLPKFEANRLKSTTIDNEKEQLPESATENSGFEDSTTSGIINE